MFSYQNVNENETLLLFLYDFGCLEYLIIFIKILERYFSSIYFSVYIVITETFSRWITFH